jgi:flavin reductase (DIM6/NTAB) family NADH-FMN oxidoreductase RutF
MLAEAKLNAVYDTMRSGLFVVTSAYRKRLAGCTCLWVTRVSFNPALVAVYLAPSRFTCQTIEKGKRFVLQALAEDGLPLARRFGLSSSRDVDKFAGLEWQPGINGIPLLAGAVSLLQCRLATVEVQGDHHLLLGEVLDAAIQHDVPQLVYDPRAFYSAAGEDQREELLLGGYAAGA